MHEPLSKVRGDRALLEIALQNLMQNALKYSLPEQPVHVVLRHTGDTAQVDVIDRGPGVAMPDKARIFEKYFRAETASAVTRLLPSGAPIWSLRHRVFPQDGD